MFANSPPPHSRGTQSSTYFYIGSADHTLVRLSRTGRLPDKYACIQLDKRNPTILPGATVADLSGSSPGPCRNSTLFLIRTVDSLKHTRSSFGMEFPYDLRGQL